MWSNQHANADLVTFTEEIFHGKLHFLCSEWTKEIEKLEQRTTNEQGW